MGDVQEKLDLFAPNPSEASDIVDSSCTEIPPDNLDLTDKILSFTIPASSTLFTSPEIKLLLRVKLELDGATAAADKEPKYAWINMAPKTIFKSMSVSFNETFIQNVQHFNYLEYVLTRLLTTESHKLSLAQTEEYLEDSINLDSVEESENPNFTKRQNHCKKSIIWEFLVDLPIYCLKNKFLLPGIRTQISFTHGEDKQRIMADDAAVLRNPKIKLTHARLLVTRLLLNQDLNLRIHNQLNTSPASYHFVRPVIKGPFLLPTGTTSIDVPISNGRKPTQLLCCFVRNKRYLGDYKLNPFKFEDLKIKKLQAIHENKIYPINVASQNYKFSADGVNGAFVAAGYDHLQRMLGFAGSNDFNGLTILKFTEGTTVFGINLSETIPTVDSAPPISIGSTSLRAEFEKALDSEIVDLFVIGFFSDRVQVSKDLVVSTSYIAGAF